MLRQFRSKKMCALNLAVVDHKRGPEMIGVLVQGLSLISGLMVNFLTPFIFGVEQYGLFIQINILVYVFHRFSDVSSESLIAMSAEGSFFLQSLIFNIFYFLLFLAISQYCEIGSSLLLAGMLLSSSVLLTLYSMRRILAVMAFLSSVVSVFLILAGLLWMGMLSLSIEQLMILSTYPSAITGFLTLAWLSRWELMQVKSYTALWRVLAILPRMISLTLVFNLLTNFIPYVATNVLMPREIGILRIMLAVVQSVSSIFPFNIKQIFSTMVGIEDKLRLYLSLMQVSVVYFVLLACILFSLAFIYSPIQPYIRLLSMLPVLYWCMLTERYLQSCSMANRLLVINLIFALGIIVGGFFCTSLDSLINLYMASIAGYCIALLAMARVRVPQRYYVLGAICVLQVIILKASLPLVLLLSLASAISFLAYGASIRTDIRTLKGEMK